VRKPLWRWDPGPYALLLLLVLVTASIEPRYLPVAFAVSLTLTIAAAVLLVVALVAEVRRRAQGPAASSVLREVGHFDLIEIPSSGGPPTRLVDTYRHRSAIEAAQAKSAQSTTAQSTTAQSTTAQSTKTVECRAMLVPDATRWYGLRLRVAVHVVADARAYHVGYLPERATERYNDGLAGLARRGRHVVVPAVIAVTELRKSGGAKRHAIDVDLGGLAAVLEEHGAASSTA
jgi:hypothetical protein